MKHNPLLIDSHLPQFSQIRPEHVEPAIGQLIESARDTIDKHLAATVNYSWKNLIEPLEDADDRLNKAWSAVNHLNSVVNGDQLRQVYNTCLPKLSEYATEVGQNERLFKAYQSIAESEHYAALDTAQKKIIENSLRDFRLSGIDLDENDKRRFKEINRDLSRLSSKFEENLLDATHAWTKQIEDPQQLSGLPETALNLFKQAAEQRNLSGWLITLEVPSYLAILTYADDRALRQELYTAYNTRASDQNPQQPQWDNSEIMENILALRHEKAQLLGFNDFTELSLATKMAESPQQVTGFLEDLAAKSKHQAQRDLEELRQYARQQHRLDDLQAWDIGYFSEKMRQHFFRLSQEEVKAFFPITSVLPGLFSVVEKLYGLSITEIKDFDSWHQDVRFFQIHDQQRQLRGQFYIDLYARPKKRGGAWMDVCVTRKKSGGHIQTPVAYLVCNFTPPTGEHPSLLTHDDVITLFHEFGHGLHHMLTLVDHLGVSGINGVEWDAVELPSQFMENWCWEQHTLQLISGHYQSGEKLPDVLFQKMLEAKNFQSGMQMVRQLEFSLFDFLIHRQYDPLRGGHIYETLDQVRRRVAVIMPPSFNRFAHGFSHIFSGGYGAGYYSYKWAEVLSSDAFSLFEENGIFDRATGTSFLHKILEQGGSRNAMELFVEFRGREPEIDALLRHNGIAA